MSRSFVIVQRWIDLFLLGIVAGAITFLLGNVLAVECNRFRSTLAIAAERSWALLLISAFIATLIFVRVVAAAEDLRLSHFRFTFCYPPTVIAVPLGIVCHRGLDAWLNSPTSIQALTGYAEVDWAAAVGFLIGAFALYLTWLRLGWTRECPVTRQSARLDDDAWLANDDPISQPEEDRFARDPLARRILRRIDGGAGAIALIGDRGEGKSSIINLVEFATRSEGRNTRVWFARVSCWGFENANAVVRHILHAAVASVNEHVDCSHLRGMPESYRRAISATGGFDRIVRLLAHYDDPWTQLRRLSPVLIAVDARLVVVVEDLDRNESRDFDPAQVVAMLHRLRSVD